VRAARPPRRADAAATTVPISMARPASSESAGTAPATAPARGIAPRALLLLAVLTIVWGSNWALFPLAVREISVWTFRSVATIGSGLLLLGFAWLRGQSLVVPREHWPALVAATLLYLVVWNICSTYAAILIPSGQASLLGSTMPLWLALITWLLFGERPSRRVALAIMLGTTGILLLMTQKLSSYADAPLGLVLGLLAGLGWAAGTLVLTRRPIAIPATVLTGWQTLLTSIPLTVGAFTFSEGGWFMPDWHTIALITYIVVVPVSIGNVCWFAIVGLLPANIAGLSPILVPVVAMITGAIALGEPFGPLQWAAMACNASALGLVLLRRPARWCP